MGPTAWTLCPWSHAPLCVAPAPSADATQGTHVQAWGLGQSLLSAGLSGEGLKEDNTEDGPHATSGAQLALESVESAFCEQLWSARPSGSLQWETPLMSDLEKGGFSHLSYLRRLSQEELVVRLSEGRVVTACQKRLLACLLPP